MVVPIKLHDGIVWSKPALAVGLALIVIVALALAAHNLVSETVRV